MPPGSAGDGGLVRYRLRLVSWTWWLQHARHSRVFQEQSVRAIVDSVLAGHGDIARGAGPKALTPSWVRVCAVTACSTAKVIAISCNGCWPKRDWAGGCMPTKSALR
jgi:hypothetical protein